MTPLTSSVRNPATRSPARAAIGAVLAATLAAAVLVAPAQAASTDSVSDPSGDVRIFRQVTGLSLAERRSIDLRRVQVTPRTGSVRFTVQLRDVPRTRSFDQMVFIDLRQVTDTPTTSEGRAAGGSAAGGSAEIAFSAQRPGLSYAAHFLGTDVESCDPLTAVVLRRRDLVRLDVPDRCIPTGEVTIKVTTLTGYFRSDAARPWSKDRVDFPGPVVLR